jgi:hypothetical protein
MRGVMERKEFRFRRAGAIAAGNHIDYLSTLSIDPVHHSELC